MSRLTSVAIVLLILSCAGGLLSCASKPFILAEVSEPAVEPEPPKFEPQPEPQPAPQPERQPEPQPAPQPAPPPVAEPEEPPIPPITGTIVEVGSSAGRQTTIYIRGLSSLKSLKTGLKGFIYADRAMTQRIGKFTLTDLYGSGAARGTVLNTETTIEEGAVIKIEIDPRYLIE